jgi:hypothetical protein
MSSNDCLFQHCSSYTEIEYHLVLMFGGNICLVEIV